MYECKMKEAVFKMIDRKVFLNKHTNLLELEEHMYPLVDVDTPNVFSNGGCRYSERIQQPVPL